MWIMNDEKLFKAFKILKMFELLTLYESTLIGKAYNQWECRINILIHRKAMLKSRIKQLQMFCIDMILENVIDRERNIIELFLMFDYK